MGLRTMAPARLGLATLAVLLGGCGGSGLQSGLSDPGTGTGTLLVEGDIAFKSDEGATEIEVKIRKNGAPLDGAQVRITSGVGAVDLQPAGDGVYGGRQIGWPDGFRIEARAVAGGKPDELVAAVAAPGPVALTSPDVGRPLDPHQLASGLVVRWAGPAEGEVQVETKEFDSGVLPSDPLMVTIPSSAFKKASDKLTITRRSSVALAGGVPGSKLTARYKLKSPLTVQNPYE
jgi:hypothetical protein